ncbi:MAG TPA: DUF202 domain-containing protein [Flavobacteriales bacterium]|nr:DUF202 domain-containing protein [Flavobacteriales bacterium]
MMTKNNIDPKDLMAVERATTALLGTSISLIVLGFVIEKFELFLNLITLELDRQSTKVPQLAHIAFYKYLSLSVVFAGILLALYTFRYYTKWIQHLKQKKVETDKNIFFVLAIFIAIIGILLMLSMILL